MARKSRGKPLDVKGTINRLARQIDDRLVLSRRAVLDGAEDLVRDIMARTPVDTGALRDSVRAEKTSKGALILVGGVNDPRVGRVDYGEFVGMEEVVASVVNSAKPRLVSKIKTEIRT